MRCWAHWSLSTATHYCFNILYREPLRYPYLNKNCGFPTVASDSNHYLQKKGGVALWTLELLCSFSHLAIELKLFKSVCEDRHLLLLYFCT